MSDRPRLSVILALRGSAADRQAVRGWLDEELRGLSAEIVSVEDGDLERGLARAAAQGAGRARGDLLAFLVGTAPQRGRWLAPLLARLAADPGLAAVGPRRVGPGGETLSANVAMTWAALRGEALPLVDPPPLALALDGLVVRADDLGRAGGIPGAYREGWAEVELCLRLADAGRRIAEVPESTFVAGAPWRMPSADEEELAAAWRARFGPPAPGGAGSVHLLPRDGLVEAAVGRMAPADVVLDIGCGIRPQSYLVPKVHVCCEPFGQYLDKLREDLAGPQDRHHVFLQAGWEQAVELFPPASMDTVFLLDVIEHLEKVRAIELLRWTQRLARKQVVVFTTLGFVAQHHRGGKDAWGLDGATWQEHRSGWAPADFGDGWEVLVSPDFHTQDNLNRPYDVPRGALWAIYGARRRLRVNRAA